MNEWLPVLPVIRYAAGVIVDGGELSWPVFAALDGSFQRQRLRKT
jgi:hypothetical protein